MHDHHTGGCQCGAVRYEIKALPVMVYACHCSLCQRQSGSAFAMAAAFPGGSMSMQGKQPAMFLRDGHEGRRFRCYFCPDCGSRIYHQWFGEAGDAPFYNIKPGTLDDTSWLRPGCHVWTENAQPWVVFDEDAVLFDRQPPVPEMPPFEPLGN